MNWYYPKHAENFQSNLALDVNLSPEDLTRIEAAIPASAIAGTRYDQHQMQMLDSER